MVFYFPALWPLVLADVLLGTLESRYKSHLGKVGKVGGAVTCGFPVACGMWVLLLPGDSVRYGGPRLL